MPVIILFKKSTKVVEEKHIEPHSPCAISCRTVTTARTHVLPSARALLHPGQDWMFQQDNDP